MKLNKKNIILSMASLSLVAAVFFFNPQKAQAKDVTFRVTDYGATGNGQTDDTKAINQLLDEAAYLSDGDTLVLTFPAGRYNISDWLHIRSNTTLDLSAGAELYRTNTMYPLMMNVGNDGTRKENISFPKISRSSAVQSMVVILPKLQQPVMLSTLPMHRISNYRASPSRIAMVRIYWNFPV